MRLGSGSGVLPVRGEMTITSNLEPRTPDLSFNHI